MVINSLKIKNYKSLIDVEINQPNNFTVFVGSNASGKSNIFEAIDFASAYFKIENNAISEFGGFQEILNYRMKELPFEFILNTFDNNIDLTIERDKDKNIIAKGSLGNKSKFFTNSYTRIFVRNAFAKGLKFSDENKLNLTCSNIANILKILFTNEELKDEIIEILNLMVPGFQNIEIKKEELTGKLAILIYESDYDKPFTDNLISDGTINLLSILAVINQTNVPQFICIEEPENGINPKVVKELVKLFREKCDKYSHNIWLATHSQTLVSELKPNEIILVDKKDGETHIKQIDESDVEGLALDEAWLTNSLGGGLPW